MTSLQFQLINQDIEDSLGFEGWACHCPIARCICRTLGYAIVSELVVVGRDDIMLFYMGKWYEIPFPISVVDWISAFDKEQDVSSFSFELEIKNVIV